MQPDSANSSKTLGKAFNRIWSASMMSNLADGLLKTAAPLLAATLTQDPILISGMAALVMLPWLLFAIPVGGMVDRVNRRLALASANAARFLVTGILAFAIATDSLNIWGLYAAAFMIGICEVVYDTTTQSMIPQVLESKNFEKGNARLQISETVIAEFLGAPLSGVLYALVAFLPFVFNSVAFAAAAILVLLVPKSFATTLKAKPDLDSEAEKTGFWKDIRFGIEYLWRDKRLMRLVITTAFIGLCFALATSTMVLFVLNEMKVTEAAFGFVMLSMGIGAILGGIFAPAASKKFGRGTIMAVASLGMTSMIFLGGFAPNITFLMTTFFIGGICNTSWNLLVMSSYHAMIPNHLFGRIHGTRRTLVWGMMPIGSLIGGALAVYGLRVPFFVGGGLSTILAILSYRFIKKLGDFAANHPGS